MRLLCDVSHAPMHSVAWRPCAVRGWPLRMWSLAHAVVAVGPRLAVVSLLHAASISQRWRRSLCPP